MRANYRSLKSLRTYSIPFTGLKPGRHEFEYAINNAFFDEFEYSLVKKANLVCKIEMEKQETMLILNFDIQGTISMTCDKCLSEYPFPVTIREQQIAKFGEEEVDESEEIITLTKNDHDINVAGLIYEYVNVAIPFISVCSDEGKTPYCDKEMLDRLKALAPDKDQNGEDPRWDALKNIK